MWQSYICSWEARTDTRTVIKDLEPEKSYRYQGVIEGDGIRHSSMRDKIRKDCFLRSKLNARNRIDATDSLALPVVKYSFTTNKWSLTKIKKLDTRILKALEMDRMHPCWYLPCKEGGTGLVQTELSLKTIPNLLLAMREIYLNEINLSADSISENSSSTEKAKQIGT